MSPKWSSKAPQYQSDNCSEVEPTAVVSTVMYSEPQKAWNSLLLNGLPPLLRNVLADAKTDQIIYILLLITLGSLDSIKLADEN